MKIDLSKKPEGATHINPHSGLWVKCFGGNSGSYQFFRNGEWEMGFGCMSNSYLEIAQPEPWTGEGLPPVGTVCEFAGFNPEETTFDDPAVGDKVTVIAHYLSGCVQVAAFTYNCASNFGSLNVAQGAMVASATSVRLSRSSLISESVKSTLYRTNWPDTKASMGRERATTIWRCISLIRATASR